ncbi:MAG: hypothetical protein CVU56_10890 [Deltaproteobacteria bacterium HGW-Deltaproteobacteria-14]|jgi:hypothetical protein|nr:MAG: hypothetical protein CVU56_10890 [Deltaproteobacteria bacterium HGW-Deltaproteobacteria-14]
MEDADETAPTGRLSWPWRIVHWVIIVNLAIQVLYGAYMVFVVMRPEGVSGPLWAAANAVPHDLMMVRRAYASETWLAIVGLSLYLGVTEILPRRLGRR